MYLSEHGYLPGPLDSLALAAMLLQVGSVLLTCGRWADRLAPLGFDGILFLVQWLVWTALVFLFLLVQDCCRRRRTPAWMKASAVVAIVVLGTLLVSQWKWPPPAYASVRPPRAPQGVTVRSVTENGLDADFFYRASDRPHQAVILLGGSEGGKSWSDCTDFIRDLVNEGFGVLSLAYFGTEGLPPQLQAVPLECFPKAFRWLAAQESVVVPNEYALVGGSRGAEVALLAGSRFPEVKAVVAIAPSSVVFQGFPTGKWDGLRGRHSPYSWNGHELAFVPAPYSWATLRGMITGRYRRSFEEALRHSSRVNEAAIPVERTRGSILLVSFTRDEV
jgi:pimeloyl-ACP methyl ester carboxylesterase